MRKKISFIAISLVFICSYLTNCGDSNSLSGRLYMSDKISCRSMTGELVDANSQISFGDDRSMCFNEACSDVILCSDDWEFKDGIIEIKNIQHTLSSDKKTITGSDGTVYHYVGTTTGKMKGDIPVSPPPNDASLK